MRTIEVTLYNYDELTAPAQAKARQWYLTGNTFDPDMDWYEQAGKLLGITFGIDGDTQQDIRWSGFGSQGDGASFVGRYDFRPEAVAQILEEFPLDETLQEIAKTLATIQGRYSEPVSVGEIAQRGRYVASHSMSISDVYPESIAGDDIDELLTQLRRFADWIYSGLLDEYCADIEDEAVAENIRVNEYEFLANGSRYIER